MNTFKSIHEQFLTNLRADLAYARTLPTDTFNTDVCKCITTTYCNNGISNIDDMEIALDKYHADTQYQSGFIKVTNELDYDVDGYSDGEGYIEVNGVYTTLKVTGYRPMTDEEFTKLLDAEMTMKSMFKKHMADIVAESAGKVNSWHNTTVDCKMLSLFKDEIIDYNQLVAATYNNC